MRDSLDGGDGNDTADYSAYATGLTVNLGQAGSIVGGSGTTAGNSDVLASIENFTGGSGADTITGNAGNNVLNGGAGRDILIGGIGADTLDSGAANDNIQDIFRFSRPTSSATWCSSSTPTAASPP